MIRGAEGLPSTPGRPHPITRLAREVDTLIKGRWHAVTSMMVPSRPAAALVGTDRKKAAGRALALAVLLLSSLLPGVLPAGTAQESAAPWELKDPVGDVRPGSYGIEVPVSAGQPTPVTNEVDIVGFTVTQDDLEHLEVRVSLVDLKAPGTYTDQYPLEGYDLEVRFSIAGTSIEYLLRAEFKGPLRTSLAKENPLRPSLVRFCVFEGPREVGCQRDVLEGLLDPGKNQITVKLPKSLLLGFTPSGVRFVDSKLQLSPVEEGTLLAKWNTKLLHWRYVPAYPIWINIQLSDTVSESSSGAVPYQLRSGVGNQLLRLRPAGNNTGPLPARLPYSPGGGGVLVAVDPGTPQTVLVRVENAGKERRLVNLSAAFATPSSASDWQAQAPGSVEVPPNATRNVTVVIQAKPGLQHRARADLLLTARSIGRPGEFGFLRLVLLSSHSPKPDRSDLRLHAAPPVATGSASCLPLESCNDLVFWMNLEAEDAAATADAGGVAPQDDLFGGLTSFGLWRSHFMLDTPLSRGFRVEEGKAAGVKVTLSGRNPFTAEIAAALYLTKPTESCLRNCRDDILLGRATTSGEIKASPTTFEFPLPLSSKVKAKPLDFVTLRLVIEVGKVGVPDVAANVLGVSFYPKASQVRLPWAAGEDTEVPRGPLRLYANLSGPEFVHPGRSRLIEARLANEGNGPERVRVTVTNVTEGWKATVQPAERFLLGVGESVALGVLLRAPDGAKEGDFGNATLEAVPENGTAPRARLRLQAIATRAGNLPDDAGAFKADEDTRKRVLSDPAGKSPGPGIVLAVLAAALVLARRRR